MPINVIVAFIILLSIIVTSLFFYPYEVGIILLLVVNFCIIIWSIVTLILYFEEKR